MSPFFKITESILLENAVNKRALVFEIDHLLTFFAEQQLFFLHPLVKPLVKVYYFYRIYRKTRRKPEMQSNRAHRVSRLQTPTEHRLFSTMLCIGRKEVCAMKKNLTINFQAPYCNTLTAEQNKASKTMCFCAVKNDIKTLLSYG